MPEGEVTPERTRIEDDTYRHVLHLILDRKLAGGSVLQERRMSEQMGVSRTPLREALRRLEGEGLVTRAIGGMLMVRLVSLEEYLQSLEVRLLIEPRAACGAAGTMPKGHVRRLHKALQAIDPRHNPTPAQHWAFDDDLHESIGDHGGNPLIANIIREMRRLTKMFERQRLPERNAPGWNEHKVLLEAIARRDGDAAAKAMTDHLRCARQSILERF